MSSDEAFWMAVGCVAAAVTGYAVGFIRGLSLGEIQARTDAIQEEQKRMLRKLAERN